MKTFEERYTAWIDGELEGNALVAFEQELVRRATVEESHADKADALRMSAFLQDHLQAPTLTNTGFFNHQLRERIVGERTLTERRPSSAGEEAAGATPWFNWSFWRLGAAGAACLFIGGALYYGTIPQNGSGSAPALTAKATPAASSVNPVGNPTETQAVAINDPAPRNPANSGLGLQAKLTQEQQERLNREQDFLTTRQRQEIEPGADIQAKVPDRTAPTTATSLHYKKPDVNVLWVSGLDYLPDASSLDSAPASAQPSTAGAAPAATATP